MAAIWKGDRQYSLSLFKDSYHYYSMAAGLSIIPRILKRGYDFKQLPTLMKDIQKVWKRFIAATMTVRKPGSNFFQDPDDTVAAWDLASSAQYMRNCPPALVTVSATNKRQSVGRYCNRYMICPFCMARRVYRIFIDIEHALKDVSIMGKYQKYQKDHLLVTTASSFYLLPEDQNVKHLASKFMPNLHAWRTKRLQMMGTDTALIYAYIHPMTTGYWRAIVRQLYLVHVKWTCPQSIKTISTIGHPTSRNLALAVGRTMEYPTKLLNGPLIATIDILNTLKAGKFRLTEKFGLFRASKNAKSKTDSVSKHGSGKHNASRMQGPVLESTSSDTVNEERPISISGPQTGS